MDGFHIAQAFMFATHSRLKEPVEDVVCAAITVAHVLHRISLLLTYFMPLSHEY